ncbi:hypothetical protein J8273_0695 [Carpediemonas membranifera]|uniref:Uncharacterized protein n=1 Tax=Carpediemonas membranifera TaxID=201153 RepID=A0A8J6B209_9EUKA|nr:hypothetical protein J8273_0695 [Carpediemonas membranifera]|eukprot:KAG9397565.1 hypothetical protein J8273_0695 [Carpediemonas membranifera]
MNKDWYRIAAEHVEKVYASVNKLSQTQISTSFESHRTSALATTDTLFAGLQTTPLDYIPPSIPRPSMFTVKEHLDLPAAVVYEPEEDQTPFLEQLTMPHTPQPEIPVMGDQTPYQVDLATPLAALVAALVRQACPIPPTARAPDLLEAPGAVETDRGLTLQPPVIPHGLLPLSAPDPAVPQLASSTFLQASFSRTVDGAKTAPTLIDIDLSNATPPKARDFLCAGLKDLDVPQSRPQESAVLPDFTQVTRVEYPPMELPTLPTVIYHEPPPLLEVSGEPLAAPAQPPSLEKKSWAQVDYTLPWAITGKLTPPSVPDLLDGVDRASVLAADETPAMLEVEAPDPQTLEWVRGWVVWTDKARAAVLAEEGVPSYTMTPFFVAVELAQAIAQSIVSQGLRWAGSAYDQLRGAPPSPPRPAAPVTRADVADFIPDALLDPASPQPKSAQETVPQEHPEQEEPTGNDDDAPPAQAQAPTSPSAPASPIPLAPSEGGMSSLLDLNGSPILIQVGEEGRVLDSTQSSDTSTTVVLYRHPLEDCVRAVKETVKYLKTVDRIRIPLEDLVEISQRLQAIPTPPRANLRPIDLEHLGQTQPDDSAAPGPSEAHAQPAITDPIQPNAGVSDLLDTVDLDFLFGTARDIELNHALNVPAPKFHRALRVAPDTAGWVRTAIGPPHRAAPIVLDGPSLVQFTAALVSHCASHDTPLTIVGPWVKEVMPVVRRAAREAGFESDRVRCLGTPPEAHEGVVVSSVTLHDAGIYLDLPDPLEIWPIETVSLPRTALPAGLASLFILTRVIQSMSPQDAIDAMLVDHAARDTVMKHHKDLQTVSEWSCPCDKLMPERLVVVCPALGDGPLLRPLTKSTQLESAWSAGLVPVVPSDTPLGLPAEAEPFTALILAHDQEIPFESIKARFALGQASVRRIRFSTPLPLPLLPVMLHTALSPPVPPGQTVTRCTDRKATYIFDTAAAAVVCTDPSLAVPAVKTAAESNEVLLVIVIRHPESIESIKAELASMGRTVLVKSVESGEVLLKALVAFAAWRDKVFEKLGTSRTKLISDYRPTARYVGTLDLTQVKSLNPLAMSAVAALGNFDKAALQSIGLPGRAVAELEALGAARRQGGPSRASWGIL